MANEGTRLSMEALNEQQTYPTIALAEAAIAAAGYVRDSQRHVWVNGNKACKVVQVVDNQNNFVFMVQAA